MHGANRAWSASATCARDRRQKKDAAAPDDRWELRNKERSVSALADLHSCSGHGGLVSAFEFSLSTTAETLRRLLRDLRPRQLRILMSVLELNLLSTELDASHQPRRVVLRP